MVRQAALFRPDLDGQGNDISTPLKAAGSAFPQPLIGLGCTSSICLLPAAGRIVASRFEPLAKIEDASLTEDDPTTSFTLQRFGRGEFLRAIIAGCYRMCVLSSMGVVDD